MANRKRDRGKSDSLDKAWQKAESYAAPVSEAEIRRLSESKDGRDRLLSLVLMRKQIERGQPASAYLPLARSMVSDSENHCRWQAAIVVGMSIESAPDEVWQVVRQQGDSKNEDMRSAMATILLEHLLEFDFDKYFSLVRAEVANGRSRLLDTLDRCSFFNNNARENKVRNYLRNATRGRPRQRYTP